MEFSQVHTSVFNRIEATPSDLVSKRNVASLIRQNQQEKVGKGKPLPARIAYKPVVFVGPSGAGKGTLINKLMEKFPNKFAFSVSCTTRQPREGEIDGVHYNFVTVEKFNEMVANDEFIEHFTVHNNSYGGSSNSMDSNSAISLK